MVKAMFETAKRKNTVTSGQVLQILELQSGWNIGDLPQTS